MGFLLRSKAEGNVGPHSSPAAATCSPELPGFAEHIQTASGSRLEPASLGSLSSGASSLGKGCQPHATSSANASLSSAASTGWGCARLLSCPLQSLDRSEKSVLPFTSRGLCLFFFWKHHFRQHRSLPGKSTPRAQLCFFFAGGNSPVGVWKRLGKTTTTKKKHTPFFLPSVFVSQHTPMVNATDFISSGKEPRKAP